MRQSGRGPTRRVRWSRAVVALLAASVCACGDASPPRNLVLIVIDSLRAGRLGCYGASRPTSPGIDSLARSGVRFARAYSGAPWTQPAVASILTGLYPSGHGLVRIGTRARRSAPTLAEILRSHGFATGAVVSHLLLGRRFGFQRGFERFDQTEGRDHAHVSTDGVTRKAVHMLETLAGGDRPFFLLVHYFDPHYAYQRHPGIGFARPGEGRVRGGEPIGRLLELLPHLTLPEVGTLRALYDEEVRFTDAGVERLLESLGAAGLDDDTLVVLVADHGEEFLDHGFVGHIRTLYEELVRVPLLFRLPGAAQAGRVIEPPVSTVSVAPTVLELLEVPAAELGAQAPSLAPLVRGGAAGAAGPVFSEVDYPSSFSPTGDRGRAPARKKALVRDGFKLIRDYETGRVELFDLGADPSEAHDLAGERPDLAGELLDALEREAARLRGEAEPPTDVELTDEERQALEGLGYLAP